MPIVNGPLAASKSGYEANVLSGIRIGMTKAAAEKEAMFAARRGASMSVRQTQLNRPPPMTQAKITYAKRPTYNTPNDTVLSSLQHIAILNSMPTRKQELARGRAQIEKQFVARMTNKKIPEVRQPATNFKPKVGKQKAAKAGNRLLINVQSGVGATRA